METHCSQEKAAGLYALESLDLSQAKAPKSDEFVDPAVWGAKALCSLRDFCTQFYTDIELFIDKFSRETPAFGLKAKPRESAFVTNLIERCSEGIQLANPLILNLAFSEEAGAGQAIARDLKPMLQNFRLYLSQSSMGGSVGEDKLSDVVHTAIQIQHGVTGPLNQLSAMCFILQHKEEACEQTERKLAA